MSKPAQLRQVFPEPSSVPNQAWAADSHVVPPNGRERHLLTEPDIAPPLSPKELESGQKASRQEFCGDVQVVETFEEAIVHLRQRLASLERRLSQVEGRTATSDTDSRASKSICSVPSQRDPEREVTQKLLDQGDMVAISESVWDAFLFIGHVCVGMDVSTMLVCVYVLNLCLQLGFTAVVYTTLLEDPLGPDTMDDLMRYRLGVAHSAQYANSVTHRSMISQICEENNALHTSALQSTLYQDLGSFGGGGVYLCLLAQTAWFVLTMVEMNDAWNFMLALWSVPRGASTKILLVDGVEDGCLDDKLEKITVVTRLVSLSSKRCLVMCVFVLAPRLLIAIVLGITGSWYLSLETSQADLILNVVALTFVVSLDEELYKSFVPRRAHIALTNMEPLHVRSFHIPPFIPVLLKTLCVGTAVLGVHLTMIVPFFEKLALAQDILCSGNTDFVYAVNPASGVVHVAKAMDETEVGVWFTTEKAIFQMARPEVTDNNGWKLDADLVAIGASPVTLARNQLDRTIALEDTPFDVFAFDEILSMTSHSVAEGAEGLHCEDLDAGASSVSSLWEVQAILGNSNITSCDDDLELSLQSCAQPEMSRFRAFCPVTCGCRDVWNTRVDIGDFTGWPATVFGSSEYGCPAACISFRAAVSSFLLEQNDPDMAIGSRCMDVPVGYLTNPDVRWRTFRSVNEDGPIPYDSNSIYIPRWLHGYITGLHALLMYDSSFSESVWKQAHDFELWGLIEPGTADALWEHIISGGIVDTIVSGTWELMPGSPHPRNLTGCAYLASYELTVLLGRDLCEVGHIRSIRNVCPVTCGCGSMAECPAACWTR